MSTTDKLSILIEAKDLASDKFKGAAKEAKDLDKAAEGVGGRFDDIKSKSAGMSTALKTGALVAAPAVAAIGVELFKTGAELEQMRAKAQVVFGDQLPMVKQWADTTANGLGLTKNEALGLAAGMSDLLIPMGFTRDEAAKMSTEVLGLSGALAAWSGGTKSATEVAEILNSALLGEREQLKGLGISISEADVQQRILEKGQQDLTGAAREQAEAQATLELVTLKSKDAQAAFADSNVTTAEKMATTTAQFREAREELADKLMPAVTGVTIALSDFVTAGTEATTASGGLQGAAADLGAAWSDATHELREHNGVLGDALRLMDRVNTFNPVFQAGKALTGLTGRASGGPVAGGTPYMVGERGPELFVPKSGGSIVPNHRLGGGGNVINVTVSALDPAGAASAVVAALKSYERTNGPIPVTVR